MSHLAQLGVEPAERATQSGTLGGIVLCWEKKFGGGRKKKFDQNLKSAKKNGGNT